MPYRCHGWKAWRPGRPSGGGRYARPSGGGVIAVSTIADLGEFGLIRLISEQLGPVGAEVILGVGDDAALIRAADGRVVATTDLLIEGRHFRRAWSSALDIGHKAAARNLADVAAMGARPTALLLGFAAPGDLPVSWVIDLVRGMAAECAATGAGIAGGDTCGAGTIMIAITALGDLGGRPPVTRSGARPGDAVAVIGTLGAAAAGLDLLAAGFAPDRGAGLAPGLAALIGAQRRPRPPYAAGPRAALAGATSMIDISDGLVADLGHVARASKARIEIDTGGVFQALGPDGGELAAAAEMLGRDGWLDWVLTGGEDHALAATFPPGTAPPAGWTVIGAVSGGGELGAGEEGGADGEPGAGVVVDGRPWTGAGGWDHFRCGQAGADAS